MGNSPLWLIHPQLMGTTNMDTTTDATRATAEAMPADPLIAAINAYHAGMAAYEGREEFETPEAEDAGIAATYGPPSDVLKNWDKPATTRAGALEALHFAARGCHIIGIDIQQNMVRAALGYFKQEGGAPDLFVATGVGRVLSEILAACENALTAINGYDDDAPFNDPALRELLERRCELALAICAYRPRSKEEQRIKVEFLRDWTDCTQLNEQEQNALFASMMPEGGAA